MEYILKINNLSVDFMQYSSFTQQHKISVLKNINLQIPKAQIVSIVGASGSGKSLLVNAILGLLPVNAQVTGSIEYENVQLTIDSLKAIRGREIAYIPQSVKCFDPTMKIGKFLSIGMNNLNAMQITEIFKSLELDTSVLNMYPHQLSGGMLRRILFATCNAENIKLILADEPTPGVHPTIINEFLINFQKLKDSKKSIVFITHDMKLAMQISDLITIFKDGAIVGTVTPQQIEQSFSELPAYIQTLWQTQPSNLFWEGLHEFAR